MELTGNELLLAHNIKGGLVKLTNLLEFVIENAGVTGGNGAVSSVNGKTGEVVLTASDVGATSTVDFNNLSTRVNNLESSGGTGGNGNGLLAVGMDIQKDETGVSPNFQLVTFYDPENYEPSLKASFALNTDKVRVNSNGSVTVDSNSIGNGESLEFQIMTVVDGYARVKFFILQRDQDGLFHLYDNNDPFSGA